MAIYRRDNKEEYCKYQRDYYWANRERILKQKKNRYREKVCRKLVCLMNNQ